MNDEYPDSDCPWTFYFNGEKMPKWTSTWSLIPAELETTDVIDVLCRDIYFKIDHLGNIESDDTNVMRLCVNIFLRTLLEKEDAVIDNISRLLSESEQKENVIANVCIGLQRMLELMKDTKVCLWTNGYSADQARLIAFMNEKHEVYPHQSSLKSCIKENTEREEEKIRRLLTNGSHPKSIRRSLLEKSP